MTNCERRERAVAQCATDQAGRAIILEKGRQLLLESAPHRELAEKKLERLSRHVQRGLAKREALVEQRWQAVAAERNMLADLFRQATDRIDDAALCGAKPRIARWTLSSASSIGSLEREFAYAPAPSGRPSAKCTSKTRTDLLREIDRLAGMFMDTEEEPILHARAA